MIMSFLLNFTDLLLVFFRRRKNMVIQQIWSVYVWLLMKIKKSIDTQTNKCTSFFKSTQWVTFEIDKESNWRKDARKTCLHFYHLNKDKSHRSERFLFHKKLLTFIKAGIMIAGEIFVSLKCAFLSDFFYKNVWTKIFDDIFF